MNLNIRGHQPFGIGLTFYPFYWHFQVYKAAGLRAFCVGPFALVISHKLFLGDKYDH